VIPRVDWQPRNRQVSACHFLAGWRATSGRWREPKLPSLCDNNLHFRGPVRVHNQYFSLAFNVSMATLSILPPRSRPVVPHSSVASSPFGFSRGASVSLLDVVTPPAGFTLCAPSVSPLRHSDGGASDPTTLAQTVYYSQTASNQAAPSG